MASNGTIPYQIRYQNVRPRGWATKYRQFIITPQSSNVYWQPNQIIRLLNQTTFGLYDPYRSHFRFKVQVPQSLMPVGGLQVDSSAQSFFQQIVIYSDSQQIQRLNQVDVLMCYLTDMGFSQWVCQNRQWQGLGFNFFQTKTFVNKANYGSPIMVGVTGTTSGGQTYWGATQQSMPGHLNPVRAPSILAGGYSAFLPSQGTAVNSTNCTVDPVYTSGSTSANLSTTNYLLNGNSNYSYSSIINSNGRLMSVRYQYQPSVSLSSYIDSTTSTLTNCPIGNMGGNNNFPSNWNTGGGLTKGVSYQVQYLNNVNLPVVSTSTHTSYNVTVPNTAAMFGYNRPYAASFAKGTDQPMLSPTIPQCQMAYGKILQQPIPIWQAQFKVPIPSSSAGIFIPVDQFLLIPMTSMYNYMIQLNLNPYAMFTTGYNDCHQYDAQGMSVMQKRNFLITQFQWVLHLYQFPQQQIQGYIKQSITKNIAITSTYYYLASQYQIPTGQTINNSWPIGTTAYSLAQVIALFIPNDYMQYSFCRRGKRNSNNVGSMFIRAGSQYYPNQPLVGNAGNPQIMDNTGNNSVYLQQLLLSNDYLFSTNHPTPKINAYNFAYNGPSYDPTDTTTYYDISTLSQGPTPFSTSHVNINTALGQCNFHQNRQRGTAAYVYSWQPYAHSRQFMMGLNVQKTRPFQIVFNVYNQNYFPRDQTLYIFTRQNVVWVYGQKITSLGK